MIEGVNVLLQDKAGRNRAFLHIEPWAEMVKDLNIGLVKPFIKFRHGEF